MKYSNFKLVEGNKLPEAGGSETSYQFSYINFADVKVISYENYNKSSSNKNKKIYDLLAFNTHIIIIDTIGDIGGLNVGNEGFKHILMTSSEQIKYDNVACAIQTPMGSIIPMPILPGMGFEGYKNGFCVQNIKDDSQMGNGFGIKWWAKIIDNGQINKNSEFVQARLNDISTYGKTFEVGYVTNELSAKRGIDHPCYATRLYTCYFNDELNENIIGPGSCVFGYYIQEGYNSIGEGFNESEKQNRANIQVLFAGNNFVEKDMLEQLTGRQSNSKDDGEKNISVIIPPEGELGFYIGGNKKIDTGTFSQKESNIVPPFCKKMENGVYNLNNLYLIPTYAGMLFTNAIVSGLSKEKSDSVFVRYADVRDPVMEAVIKNDGNAKTKDIKESIKASEQELMNWFPSVIQERGNNADTRIKVPYKNNIRFGNTIQVRFTKCVGRFAYCPVYFQRYIKFTYYFKGEYVSDNEVSGKYSFYPVMCSNVGESTKWIGINEKGASCISRIKRVYVNSQKQEAVYGVDLEFKASSFQRYPLEIFGMCIVYKYTKFQFSIQNDNGNFEFNENFQRAFTYIYRNRSRKKFFDLITNCSINSSLDGVSGSLSLDGYALDNGIDTWLQDQSLGEVDIDIKWIENISSFPLFKGYAGEIQSEGANSGYNINVNLYGTNKKMSDMKLICAPFWDGDKLRTICKYFEAYLNLKLYMCDYSVTSYSSFKDINKEWEASPYKVTGKVIKSDYFRVPTSVDWRSPSIDFQNGTECLTALKELATKCGCLFVVQPDGKGVFYEMDIKKGYPYYVWKQHNVEEFDISQIISFSMSPSYENNFNSIATFGFLKISGKNGKEIDKNDLRPGTFFTKVSKKHAVFPWSYPTIGVETGFYTISELAKIHANRVVAATNELYKGTLTVVGNTRVNHLFQRIKVGQYDFYVYSIEHNIDVSNKMWTTTYGINWCSNL